MRIRNAINDKDTDALRLWVNRAKALGVDSEETRLARALLKSAGVNSDDSDSEYI